MSAFIALVVVGASIAIVTRIVTDEVVKPATPRGRRDGARQRARSPARPPGDRPPDLGGHEPAPRLRWWQRVRSAALLTVMVAVLGFAAAGAVGLATVLLITFLRNAVG